MAKPGRLLYIDRMRVPFRKMHGCGNDFVVLDARDRPIDLSPERVALLADRRQGIGCDQVIAIEPPPEGSGADALMRILNRDGSEASACGNATRCVAALLAEPGARRHFVIRTPAGNLAADILPDGRVQVDMGAPGLDWRDIPLARLADTLHLDISAGPIANPAAASMGNPHMTFFVADIAGVPLAELGARLEHHPLFPDRANIGVAQILSPDRIRLRVWERGAGLTLACGSGACAALVNAHRRALAGRRATVALDGGALDIEWRPDGHVWMTGPVATAFTGSVDLDAYSA